MKTRFLLPHGYKKLGWLLFVPALVLACFQFFGQIEPAGLDFKVLKLFDDGRFLAYGKTNAADELVGILLMVSCMLLVFSREKDEDEFIMKLRLESILWAALVNGFLVLAALVLTYDFLFFNVMVVHLFLLFLLFVVRFHWVLSKLRNRAE